MLVPKEVEEFQRLQACVEAAHERLEAVVRDRTALWNSLQELAAELAAARQELEQRAARVQELTEQNSELQQALAQKQRDCPDVADRERLQKELNDAYSSHDKADMECAQLKRQAAALGRENLELRLKTARGPFGGLQGAAAAGSTPALEVRMRTGAAHQAGFAALVQAHRQQQQQQQQPSVPTLPGLQPRKPTPLGPWERQNGGQRLPPGFVPLEVLCAGGAVARPPQQQEQQEQQQQQQQAPREVPNTQQLPRQHPALPSHVLEVHRQQQPSQAGPQPQRRKRARRQGSSAQSISESEEDAEQAQAQAQEVVMEGPLSVSERAVVKVMKMAIKALVEWDKKYARSLFGGDPHFQLTEQQREDYDTVVQERMWLNKIAFTISSRGYASGGPQSAGGRGPKHDAESWRRMWADVGLVAANCRAYNSADDAFPRWLRACADKLDEIRAAFEPAFEPGGLAGQEDIDLSRFNPGLPELPVQ